MKKEKEFENEITIIPPELPEGNLEETNNPKIFRNKYTGELYYFEPNFKIWSECGIASQCIPFLVKLNEKIKTPF